MANVEIGDLSNKTTPLSTDEVEIQATAGGVSNKATIDNLSKGINLDNVSSGTTNKVYTSTEQTKLAGIETGADVTDTTNVTAAGALMDSEVDADIKTLSLPASTTISAFGATLVDDADAATARTTIGLGNVDNTSDATKNSASATLTNKTIAAGSNTISGIANTNLTTTAGDLGGAWASWTPTLSGRFDDADWTKTCFYTQIGKTVHYRLHLIATTAAPMGGGTAEAIFTLPVTSVSYPGTNTVNQIGSAGFLDSGTVSLVGNVVYRTTTTAIVRPINSAGTYLDDVAITSAIPFTWTTSDEITATGTYEAA